MSVPNQKIAFINKTKLTSNFLQIGIDEWQTAARILKPSAFVIYLYLASNTNHSKFEISRAAIMRDCGIKSSSYYSGIQELIDNRYLVQRENGNVYDFYTTTLFKEE